MTSPPAPPPASNAAPRAEPRRERGWNTFQRRYAPYIFISPFFLLFFAFGLFPILFNIYLSFMQWQPGTGLGDMQFVGLRNYTDNITDLTFRESLKNTAILALISGVPQHLLAIPLAFAVAGVLSRIKNLVTAVYFLPYITSIVAISVIFFTLFSWQYGVINAVVSALHQLPLIGGLFPAEKINWLGQKEFVRPAVALVVIWRYTGWNMLLYLAGIQAIPRELYEAASVDGATEWQQFRLITLPLLRPIMFVAVTLSLIGGLQLFEEPYILTNGTGGAGQAALTTIMYMYRTYAQYSDEGLAAAMSWLLFAIIAALTFLNNRFFRSGLEGET